MRFFSKLFIALIALFSSMSLWAIVDELPKVDACTIVGEWYGYDSMGARLYYFTVNDDVSGELQVVENFSKWSYEKADLVITDGCFSFYTNLIPSRENEPESALKIEGCGHACSKAEEKGKCKPSAFSGEIEMRIYEESLDGISFELDKSLIMVKKNRMSLPQYLYEMERLIEK